MKKGTITNFVIKELTWLLMAAFGVVYSVYKMFFYEKSQSILLELDVMILGMISLLAIGVWRKFQEINLMLEKNQNKCLISISAFFSDMKIIESLIKNEHVSPLSHDFITEAESARDNSIYSMYVAPITTLTFNFFIDNDENKKWFNESDVLDDGAGKQIQKNIRRVVIVGEDLSLHNAERVKKFIYEYKEKNWKIIEQKHLKNKRLFRDFCIFKEKKGKKTAFFTYIDTQKKHYFYQRCMESIYN